MINNILLYNSGGGLGDSLQLIPIINSLKSHYKSSNIYILKLIVLINYKYLFKKIYRHKII